MKTIHSFTYNGRRVELREIALPALAAVGGPILRDSDFRTYIDDRCISGSTIGTRGILCEDPERDEDWEKEVKRYIDDGFDRG